MYKKDCELTFVTFDFNIGRIEFNTYRNYFSTH